MSTNKKQKRGEKVNEMKNSEVKTVIENLIQKGKIYQYKTLWICSMVPNKEDGYAQADVTGSCKNGSKVTGKVLVHHLWFRYKNNYAKVQDGMEISHLHNDTSILNVIEESWEMNQSRKWCHHFGWYKPLQGEQHPRCPHKENPCQGNKDGE